MTTISNNVSQEDKDQARTQNRAVLQEAIPTIDISVGGPVDSLLVEGNVAISAQNDADIDNALLVTQLQAIADGDVTVTDADMDRLMDTYFLTRQAATKASGNVLFIVRDNRAYTFQTGYRLRSGGQAYQITSTLNVYPIGTTGVDFNLASNIRIQHVFDSETGFQYQFELPIESLNAVQDAALVAGDRLTVDQSFDGLGYVEAANNFSGGFPAEANREFATRGLDGLLAQVVGGQDHIRKVALTAVQRSDTSAVGTGDVNMTRDRNNVFNLPTGGKTDIYAKSGAPSQASYLVDAVVTNLGAREVTITLTREQSAGVYRQDVVPYFTSTPPTIVSGSVTVTSVNHLTWTDSSTGAFNPEMPDEYDRAFSARQQVQLVFTDTRQDGSGFVVAMTAMGQTISDTYAVPVQLQPELLLLDQALTDAEVRPPGTDVLVKAAVPCITTLGVVAAKPVEYNGPNATSIEKSLATLINQLPIETSSLDSLLLSGLLREIDETLSLQSVALSGTILGQNGTDISVGPIAGKLTIPTDTTAKVSAKNTYFTTTVDLVTVSLV